MKRWPTVPVAPRIPTRNFGCMNSSSVFPLSTRDPPARARFAFTALVKKNYTPSLPIVAQAST
jgi:hypothetical protein